MGNSDSKQKENKSKQVKKEATKSEEVDPSLFEWEKDKDVPQRLDFDLWYPLIAKYTMNSVLIECTKEEVEAITISCDENRPSVLTSESKKSNLTETHKQTLQLLSDKINKFITDNGYSESGIFVRFSKRSPKDAILRINTDEFNNNVEENAMNIFNIQKENKLFTNIDINGQIINAIIGGMTISSCSKLCVKNGNDAIKLITNSQRIFQDFKIGALVLGEDEFRPKLILREFNHNIDFQYEFRVFVFKNNITAITQYNSMIYLSKLIENKQKFIDGIQTFWKQNIHQNMKENDISSYVMDLGLLKDDKKDVDDDNDNDDEKKMDDNDNDDDDDVLKFILIEMNPFCTKAGALLFDWKKDVKIMTSEPITFRILETPYNEKPPKLTSELNQLFDNLYNKMKQ